MSKKQIVDALESWGNTLFIGAPGTGKTSAILDEVKRVSVRLAQRGFQVITVPVSAAQLQLPDISGLPAVKLTQEAVKRAGAGASADDMFSHGVTVRLLPEMFVEMARRDVYTIYILDELQHVQPDVGPALLALITHGVVGGGFRLANTPLFIGIANPPEFSGGARITPNLAARFRLEEWEVDPKEWCAGFPGNWGSSLDCQGATFSVEEWIRARGLVAAFVDAHPNLLVNIPRERQKSGLERFPSPRNWEGVSKLVALGIHRGYKPNELAELASHYAGWVGDAASQMFASFLENSLVNPKDLLEDPSRLDVKELSKTPYAASLMNQLVGWLTAMEAMNLSRQEKARLIKAAWKIARVVKSHHGEIGVAMAVNLYTLGLADPEEASAWKADLEVAKARVSGKAL